MILQSTELSSRQNPTVEKLAARTTKVATVEERKRAADRMRYQLYLLDPSERRMSIEDYAAALLEKAEASA